ncbi:MAG: universal stress protein [Desulfobulbaceae bacterium]|nr:universal stress protein [Desulfobulbaceae bacterium]
MDVPQISICKILYTTDLSETGRHAFAHAASLARVYDAKLSVIHVVDEQPELDQRLVGYMKKDLWEEIKSRGMQEAKETLVRRQRNNSLIIGECVDQYCSEIRIGSNENKYITYDIVIKLGDPVEEIVKYATKEQYDLIVTGRHAHSALHEAVHRSTVRKIIDATNIPVLVIQLPE